MELEDAIHIDPLNRFFNFFAVQLLKASFFNSSNVTTGLFTGGTRIL